MNNFDKRMASFDKDFARARKWGVVGVAVSLIISGGLVGFCILVVIIVMKHFGIL